MHLTASMDFAVKAAQDRAMSIAAELRGLISRLVFAMATRHRDRIHSHGDDHKFFDFNPSMYPLVAFLSRVYPMSGGNDPNDWRNGLTLALTRNSWPFVWMADEGEHGNQFCGFRNREAEVPKLESLIVHLALMRLFVQRLDVGDGAKAPFIQFVRKLNVSPGARLFVEIRLRASDSRCGRLLSSDRLNESSDGDCFCSSTSSSATLNPRARNWSFSAVYRRFAPMRRYHASSGQYSDGFCKILISPSRKGSPLSK
jgi:hypothetical protein